MGISHPLSDEYDALRGAVLSPETTPPSSPLAHRHLLEHEVTRMDTLAGIAIKYGVEISDIKRANSLVTDSQMFAHKTLIIPPLPGMAMPSSVDLNASGQRTKRTWAPNHGHGQKRGAQPKSCQQGASPAMNTLQRYYGLTPPQKGGNTNPHRSTELSVYDKGETLLNPSAAPGTDRSWNFEAPAKETGFSATKAAKGDVGAPRPEQDGSMRQRQKVEAESDAQGDFLVKAIKRMLISSIRLDTDAGSPDSSQKSGISFLGGFKSMTVRKSPSAPSFEHGASMMWSSSKWTFSHDSFTRPLLDGLPKPASARRTKTALD